MNTSESIRTFAAELPEGTIISARELLHLGTRAAVDQALSRLVRNGELMRVKRGLFALPMKTRFGERGPGAEEIVRNIAKTTGETYATSGASATNVLGLSTQNPIGYVFWTSGPSRQLKLAGQRVKLQHVPNWQLRAKHSRAGLALRALVWNGKSQAGYIIHRLKTLLNEEERNELFALRAGSPTWLARELAVLAEA